METAEFLDRYKKKIIELGVGAGDMLYVASDITGLLYLAKTECGVRVKQRDDFLNAFVDMLQEVVGPEGTLLFPVFSWDWCRGNGFDYRSTPGEVGALNNWILKNREDFTRTKHPIYSFMVWGKNAHRLAAMSNQDAWSDAGPFTYLRDNNGKQLFFDIEAHQGITFGHYVEQCVDVPYRHPKYFFGEYTDKYGVTEKRCYSMYVRDLEVVQEISITNDWLVSLGVAKHDQVDGIDLTVCNLAQAYPFIVKDMRENNGANTLKFENYELDWKKGKTLAYEVKGIE